MFPFDSRRLYGRRSAFGQVNPSTDRQQCDLPTTSKGLAALGADRITQTGASAGSVIDLINLPSGIKPISDGHGGGLYSLGHGASIDVINFATVQVNGLPTTYLPNT